MPGTVDTDIRKRSRILVLTGRHPVDSIVKEWLRLVHAREMSLQTIDLRHYDSGTARTIAGRIATYHSFHTLVVYNIICIAGVNKRPDASVDRRFQIRLLRPHPIACLCKVIIHIPVGFLPCGLGANL